jgi:hypothetical protein
MEIRNYADFWDFYVREHGHPMNRLMHFIGTTLGVLMLVWFIASGRYPLIPLCFVVGYGFAWFGHFFVEKNKPASFKYPLWSFISDYRMVFYMLTGRMNSEVERIKSR